MTDKEQLMAIRTEIERLKEEARTKIPTCETDGEIMAYKNILSFVDSMQASEVTSEVEPKSKFKAGDHIKPSDKCLGSPRIIEEVCDGWYVTDKGTLDFEFEDNWELVEEPAGLDKGKLMDMLEDSLSKETKESWNERLDKEEEPVSDDLDKAVVEYMSQFSGENYYNSPWVMDSTGMAMPKELARFGANWQKQKELERLQADGNIYSLAGRYAYEEWDEDDREVGRDSFIDGYNICKQQMMKDAVDAQYRNIMGEVLLAFDPKKLGIKNHDKVKVLIIKDE